MSQPSSEPATPEPRNIRILLVDRQRLFREGLRRLFECEPGFEVVGEAANAFEGGQLVEDLRPDVVLLDPAVPGTIGAEAVAVVVGELRLSRVLLLTEAIERNDLVQALQLGAQGLVLKDSSSDVLVRAIRGVVAGEYWVGRDSIGDLVSATRALFPNHQHVPPEGFGLTPRELQIIATVVAAYPNREIAQMLGISEKTVKHHLTNVFDKVGVSNRLELALFALHHGLPLPPVAPLAAPSAVSTN